jgi:uncharacterized protein (TIGR00369 family)
MAETRADEWAADVDALRDLFNGSPGMSSLAIRCEALEHGWARCVLEPPADALNPNGAVNGGWLAALADQAGSLAATSGRARQGDYLSTVTLSVHFMRAATVLPVVAEAQVVSRSRRLVTAVVDARDGDGRPCMSVTGSWYATPDAGYEVP